ncbi:MAG: alpha/beta hydrolase [Anaerolineae bacterium]|jgi:pimeloyl-ACP methyl ester carboxylesterase|nr:alpha/beta hydrolase [Anaerolineae bacterium]
MTLGVKPVPVLTGEPIPPECGVGKRIALPLCELHYVEVGEGPPLIIVPATMSDLSYWYGLIQFAAQRFHVFFFELPGHGQSTPLPHYSSQQVAQVIGDWLDALGLEHVTLMGVSFGGIVTLTILKSLSERIDKVILLSPLVDSSALQVSSFSRVILHSATAVAQYSWMQKLSYASLQSKLGSRFWAQVAVTVGNMEHVEMIQHRLQTIPYSTIQAFSGQMTEILNTHEFLASAHYPQPCYFAMSVHDPLLSFPRTSAILHKVFDMVEEVPLDLPYHQPREPLTFEYLNRNFHHLLERVPV